MATLTDAELEALVEAIATEPLDTEYTIYRLQCTKSGQRILSLSSSDQIALIRYLFTWLKCPGYRAAHPKQSVENWGWQGGWECVLGVLGDLLRLRPILPTDLMLEVIKVATGADDTDWGRRLYLIPARELLIRAWQALEQAGIEPPPELRQGAETLCTHFQTYNPYEATLLRSVIQPDIVEIPLHSGEAWTDCALASLSTLPTAEQRIWVDLLTNCWLTDDSKPTRSWWEWVNRSIAQIGTESLQQHLATWLNLAAQPRTNPVNPNQTRLVERYSYEDGASNLHAMATTNVSTLKGLCWIASRHPTPEIVCGLEQVVLAAFQARSQVGPLCVRLGNAAIWALGDIADFDSTVRLMHLNASLDWPSAQKSIAKALTDAAKKSATS